MYNIKMDFRDAVCEGVKLVKLDQDRVQWRDSVNRVMNLWFP
jgi:hypothetical protein